MQFFITWVDLFSNLSYHFCIFYSQNYTDGNVIYESNMSAEYLITSYGHYNDKRSGNKGVEFENTVYAPDLDLLFVISERSSVIMV